MRVRLSYIPVFLLMALAVPCRAQSVYADPEYDLRGRVSAAVDLKLIDGLHLGVEEEARFDSMMGQFDRLFSTVDLSWKLCRHLKLSGGYSYIYEKNDCRHRANLGLTASFKTGRWNFSFRERLQCTHITKEFNTWQQPRNGLDLKSRVKSSYKLRALPLQPYMAVELKTRLNGARYLDYTPESMSFNDVYLSRTRLSLGTDWHIDNSNILDFYLLLDHGFGKKVDADKSGNLKSVSFTPKNNLTVGLAYKFKN